MGQVIPIIIKIKHKKYLTLVFISENISEYFLKESTGKSFKMHNNTINIISGNLVEVLLVVVSLLVLEVYHQA